MTISKLNFKGTANGVTKGKIIPATVIEEKNRSGLKNNYQKLKSKLKQNLMSWEKIEKWLLKCNVFESCLFYFVENTPATHSNSNQRDTDINLNYLSNSVYSSYTTGYNGSRANIQTTPINPVKSSNNFSFDSTPISLKQRTTKSNRDLIREEISLRDFNLDADTNKTKSSMSQCFTCFIHNQNNNFQYLEDIYECPECAEIYLDVNNNYKKSSSKFSLYLKKTDTFQTLTNNLCCQPMNSKSSDNFSKVTFASLFGDPSIFDQYNETSGYPSGNSIKNDRPPNCYNNSCLRKEENVINEEKTMKASIEESNSISSVYSNQNESKEDIFYEVQSMSIDLTTTDSEYAAANIYETDFIYI